MSHAYDLDKSLINFSTNYWLADWTIREAVEGVGIFGGIGSGKTSGSGRLLAKKYLSDGFGGLVLTAKPERELWEQYCRETNRQDDLIIVEPGGQHHFNFIEYESSNKNGVKPIVQNIVEVLQTVIRSSEEKSGGKSDDPFWESALDMLVYNTIELCLLAYGKVSIQQLYDVAMSIPKSGDEANRDKDGEKKIPFYQAFAKAQEKIQKLTDMFEASLSVDERNNLDYEDRDFLYNVFFEAVPDARTLQSIDQFFIETFRTLSEKTRSIIEFAFNGFLFRMLKDPVYSLFCNKPSTFKPEDCLDGKIIILNLPIKTYHKIGRDCQVLFKYIWQRAMEKRNIRENGRPVFLFADEAQHFLHEYDSEYQATARSSRIATVYISQNLANYHANMGGTKSEHRVKSFLGTLGTKIFHSNADTQTNEYASALIGDGYTEDISTSSTMAGEFSTTRGKSFRLERMVRPEEFVGLRNGGPKNKFLVDGYMHRQANPFPDGMNFRKITFSQTNS
ncbi:MAG TPA: TraM recognition domain-containing protein [Chitinophagaceae bacterium]|nr:TraM recognition domain-containing protein [Chitinophagaceae bacterium]